ncbi:MAG TPA: OmpA family protein [Pseudomonadales bacterium]|nr:OmpA family protein [Pseudomonadales bacterium]
MSSRLRFLISIVALCSAASVWADAPEKGQFYIHPEFVYYDPPGKLGYDNAATAPGIILGWSFAPNWAGEGQYYKVDPELKNSHNGVPIGGKGQVESWSANVLYHLPMLGSWFAPFATIGGGKGDYDRDNFGKTSTQNEYNFGLGAYLGNSKRFAFRFDVRGIYLNDAEKLQPYASAGLVLKLGRVEAPPAPPPAPPPVVDSDGDGVPDSMDQCPNTPHGVKVDSVGCPLDSDGDGVPDYLDKCPNTPKGTKVDATGCPIPVATTFDLTVEFAFNSAEINDLSFRELRKAMTFMRDNPNTNAVVEGNTDNKGTEAYNQKLSERRAAAVKDVLVKSGIDASRLTTVGYGETRPVASNDTEEGRQKNRRVSIVVK